MTQTDISIPKTSRLTIAVVLLFVVVLALLAGRASAQSSNPSISALPYSFTSYTGSSMPASLKIGKSSTSNLSTADFTTDASHGSSGSEWDDEGNNGISYRGNSSTESGCFKVRMNTTGLTNISVSWTGRKITDGSSGASSYMELQWRNGASGNWNNVSNDQYDSDNNSTTFNVLLPAAANNLADLQIRWIVYDQNFNFGNRDRVAVDDISICAATPATAGNNGPICSGLSLNLTASVAGLTYAWTGPNSFSSNQQNPSISNATSAATGTYTLVVTNGSGCAYTTTTAATVNTVPAATASVNNPVCTGKTMNLTSGPSGYSYQWSGPGGYTSTSQNPSRTNVTSGMAGTYTVTVTNAGCSSTASVTVNVNTSPSAITAGSNSPVCSGTALNLTASTQTGNYQWSGPAGFSSTQQNPTISSAPTNGSGTYTVTLTNAAGCSVQATTSVTVTTTPAATASNGGPECVGQTLNLTASPSGYSYLWSGPNGFSSTSRTPSISNVTMAAAGTYSVTVTNGACSSNASTNVVINPIPVVSAGSNTPLCAGNGINLTANPSGGSYQWSGPSSFSSSSQNPTRNNAQVSHSGTYTVTVTVSGCSASATTSVVVNHSPTVAPASTASNVCEGSPVTVNANSALSFVNTTAVAIPDNNSTGVNSTITLPAMSVANAAEMEVTLTFNSEHTYAGDVIVKLTNPASQTTFLFDRPGVPASTYGNSDDLNGSYTFSTSASMVLPETTGSNSTSGNINQGVYLPSSANGSSHNWSGFTFPVSTSGNWVLNVSDRVNGDDGDLASWSIKIYTTSGMSYTWTSTPAGFSASTPSITENPVSPITYNVVASYNGCNSGVGSKSVTTTPAPTPILNSNAPVCEGFAINFSGNNAAPGQSSGNTYQWSGPNGFASTQQNPNISTAGNAQVGIYTMTVTNQFLCSATTTLNVTVNSNPTLNVTSLNNVSCNGFMDGNYQITATGGSPDYIYSDGANFNLDGIFTGNAPGTYFIQVLDANGCEAFTSVDITEPDVLSFTEVHADEFCTGQSNGSVTITANGGTTPYLYSVDNGANYQNNAVFSTLTPGNYTAIIADANNCPVSPVPFTIASTYINYTTPLAITTDDADNQICAPNQISLTQAGGDLGNAPGTIYKWHIGSCNGPLAGSGTSGNLALSPTSTTTYYLNIEGLCGVSNCVPVNVVVSTASPSASVVVPPINGLPAYACNGTMASLSVPSVAGATQYIWDGPAGSNFESSGNTYTSFVPSANLLFGNAASSGYYIGVQAANACGSTLRKVQWVRGIVSVPAAVIPGNGTLTQCQNTSATFSCAPITGATGYDWVVTGDATLVSNMNSATVTFGNSWNGGTLSVAAKTPCYISPYKSVTLNTSASPTTQITGVFTACPGALQSYSVAPVSGAGSYNWTLPVNSSGASNTNSVNVNFNSGFTQGDICVQVTSNCGVVSPQKCITITSGAPSRPASISGATNGICGQMVTYQTPPIAGGTFNWTLPAGSTGTSTTNSIGAQLPNNLTTGQVCVSVTNGCGTSPSRCVTVKGAPNSPTSIMVTQGVVCANDAGVQFVADVSNIFGLYSLVWSYPASTSYVAGQNTNNLILDWGPNNGVVQLTASNSCGTATKAYMVNLACRVAGREDQIAEPLSGKLEILPNPASSFINVAYDMELEQDAVLKVLDLQGRTVYNRTYKAGSLIRELIDVTAFAKGTYLMQLNSVNFNTQSKLVIK